MTDNHYNYSHFDGEADAEKFIEFAKDAPLVTMRAPSYPLEDLASGETVRMKELWSGGIALMEFGSFT